MLIGACVLLACLGASHAADPVDDCSQFGDCTKCLQGPTCSWCHTIVHYNDTTVGRHCADSRDKPWKCDSVKDVPPAQCSGGYVCNVKLGKCVKAAQGFGLDLQTCSGNCNVATFKCDKASSTCLKCNSTEADPECGDITDKCFGCVAEGKGKYPPDMPSSYKVLQQWLRLPNTRYKHRSYYQVGTNSNAQGRKREDSYQTASNNVVSDRVVTREGYQYDDALIANPRTCTNLSFTETVNGIVNFRNYGAMVASPDIVPRVVSPPDTISGFTNAIAYFKDQDTYNVTIWVAYGDPVELDGTILQLYDSEKEQVFQKGLIFFSEYGFPVQDSEFLIDDICRKPAPAPAPVQ